MKLKRIILIFTVHLLFISLCFSQLPRKHMINDFSVTLNKNPELSNIPISAFLGSGNPMYESQIRKAYFVETDSTTYIIFDILLTDADSLRYLEIEVIPNKMKNSIYISSNLTKRIPGNAKEILVFRNIQNKKNNSFPYFSKWEISYNSYLRCITFQGCIDTDRSNLNLFVDDKHISTQSNLGWVSLVKLDIDKNGKTDIIYVSNKFCEMKMEFYTIIF